MEPSPGLGNRTVSRIKVESVPGFNSEVRRLVRFKKKLMWNLSTFKNKSEISQYRIHFGNVKKFRILF